MAASACWDSTRHCAAGRSDSGPRLYAHAQPIVVVESDKADMDVESFSEGILAAVVVNEGERANVGAPIAFVAESESEVEDAKMKAAALGGPAAAAAPAAAPAPAPAPAAPAAPAPAPAAAAPAPAAVAPAPAPAAPAPAPAAPAPAPRADGRVVATPYAKQLAKVRLYSNVMLLLAKLRGDWDRRLQLQREESCLESLQ